jgi:hypothetical protein
LAERSIQSGRKYFKFEISNLTFAIRDFSPQIEIEVVRIYNSRITTHDSRITCFISRKTMRIKIIGENHCARATRHLLRLAGFAVTDFLPADAVIDGPAAGYAITIDLSPAPHTPNAHLGPDCATQLQSSSKSEEADRVVHDASSSPFTEVSADVPTCEENSGRDISSSERSEGVISFPRGAAGSHSPNVIAGDGIASYIHFDSVDSALEAAVLRHVAQLAAGPVILDRPGGVVHSERELRIVAPVTGDARMDEAAAVAIEFGVLRGLLDLVAPDARGERRWNGAGKRLLRGDADGTAENNLGGNLASRSRKKSWWPFAVGLFCAAMGLWKGGYATVKAAAGTGEVRSESVQRVFSRDGIADGFLESRRLKPAPLKADTLSGEFGEMVMESHRLKPVLLKAASVSLLRGGFADAEPQGQFATGQGVKITDGTNVFVVDPCKAQTKLYASINQTGNTQLVAGTAAKKIYVCSIHVVAAAATNIAVVEGTGSVCATGTAGVTGFGGATAATGWNFAGNSGIALGNGDSSLGAEGTSGDNLCILNSGAGQVSGGISYVVE